MPLEDEAHPNPHGLRHERGTTPQMVGRYPDYDVLTQQRHWDDETRRVVLDRVENVPEITFFTPAEVDTLKAFCDIATAQDEEPRIPVLSYVDEKLASGTGDGYQYYDLPSDGETWRRVARGLDEEAKRRSYDSFAAAPEEVQVYVVHDFAQAQLHGGVWETHPWAWNEIGFGGPAYPRGYGAFGSAHLGEEEHWEADESVHYDPVRDTRKRGLD
jgi:hypothetical protein